MKKLFFAASLSLLIGAMAILSAPADAQTATITLLNDLPTHLEVGESYTIDIQVTSDEPFIWAMALRDTYYPGRGISFHDSDRARNSTFAVLHMTLTGKSSTAELPGGVAPAAVVVGVRYKGGVVVSERFDFEVAVP